MPRTIVLRNRDVLDLRRRLPRTAGAERSTLLRDAVGQRFTSPAALREWHDLLLFLLAHPADEAEHRTVGAELERITALANEHARTHEHWLHALTNSGIAGPPLQSTFTLRITRWMVEHWKDAVELFSVEAPLEEATELLRLLLPPAASETVDRPVSDTLALLDRTLGENRKGQLHRLVLLFDALQVDDRTREHLWARLQVYVKVSGEPACGLTHARAPSGTLFLLPDGPQRGVDLRAVVEEPVGAPLRISEDQRTRLVGTCRTVLAALHRETDPVTHPGAVELFDMGRGLRIVLLHLDAAHRLPFDSYVGFMAFRNGVPLAYGGALDLPGRSKVGINVFPALRGGESAWFFAQLLRLYRQRFAVDRFEAENYQLGHNNPDGLKSGAYWFYHRLGFRPTDNALRKVAERALRGLSSRRRSPVPPQVLRTLVEHGLELVLAEEDGPVVDTGALTLALEQHVVRKHGGDHQLAMRRARERLAHALPLEDLAEWSPGERTALSLWTLPLDMIDDLERWPAAERYRLARLVRAKGAPAETGHQRVLRGSARLLSAFHRVAARVDM